MLTWRQSGYHQGTGYLSPLDGATICTERILTQKISNERTVEVGYSLRKAVGGHKRGRLGTLGRLAFVIIIAHDKAQEKTGHDDVAKTEHGEVTGILYAARKKIQR